MWKNCWILRFVPLLLGLKFIIGFYRGWGTGMGGGGRGAGLASLWCKCCANVVVPLVTVKGRTTSQASPVHTLVLGRDHSPSSCFTDPLTNSSVHIIKILHMKPLKLPVAFLCPHEGHEAHQAPSCIRKGQNFYRHGCEIYCQ